MPDEATPDTPVSEPAPAEQSQSAPEPVPTAILSPEPPTGLREPLPFSKTDDRQENQVAHMPANEPIAPTPEPLAQPSVPVSVFAPVLHLARDLAAKARAVIQNRKRIKLDKIMRVVNTKGKITNDQVEKLLHVSDATATRYLAQLEKEGKVKQEGKTGKGVVYLKL